MDETRITAISRTLGAEATRRGVIGVLAALLSLGTIETEAGRDKRKRGQGRRQDRQRAKSGGAPGLEYRDCSRVAIGPGADLSSCDMPNARLQGANLVGANLSNARLVKGSLRGAILEKANMTGLILDLGDLSQANLRHAILVNARLGNVYFVDADLTGANLEGSDRFAARYCHTIMPDGTINNRDCR